MSLLSGGAVRWIILGLRRGPLRRDKLGVGNAADPLGPGRHGSIHAPGHWFRHPCGIRRWCRPLSNVQPCHSKATLDVEVPELRQRRFHQWQANLRVLELTQIKSIPYVPLSHPFVERLIGNLRREYLDRLLFWTTTDLEKKLLDFRTYFNNHRTHNSLEGRTPDTPVSRPIANLRSFGWQPHCRSLFQTPMAA
jgi:hypothetical protein